MRKKPKPNTEGCRWKVLWTLLLGILLFGASNASAYSVTFQFKIPEAGLDYVQFFNDNLDPIKVPMTGNKAVFDYTKLSGVFIAIPDVYTTTLTISGAEVASGDIIDYGSIMGDGLYYYRLEIKTSYSGATYTFTDPNYVEPQPEPAEFKSVVPATMSNITLSTPEAVSFTATYTAPVKIDLEKSGYGRKEGLLSASNAQNLEYSEEWILTFPASYIRNKIYAHSPDDELAPGISATVYALDTNGDYVQINGSDYFDVYYILNYTGEFGVPVTIRAEGSATGHLDTFTVNIPDGFNYVDPASYLKNITITNESGFTATAVSMNDGVVTFAPYINKSGLYTISYPYGAFTVGTSAGEGQEGDVFYSNAEGKYQFEVTITNPDPDQSTTPSGETLPIEQNFTPQANTDYVYTPATDGTLNLTITDGDALFYFWFTSPLLSCNGKEVEPTYTNGDAAAFRGATEFTWELEAGKSYIFNLPVNKTAEEFGTYYFSWEGEEPGYETLVLGNPYTVSGIGSLKLIYTPEADGILVAAQTGSNESHLFTQEPSVINESTGQVSETGMYYTENVSGNTLKYEVKANSTYYVYAKINAYDGITGVTFTFEEPSGGEEDDEYALRLGETYTVNYKSPVYHYTAKTDGILRAQTNAWGSILNAGMREQYFMWTDASHNRLAKLNDIDDGNGGCYVDFAMTAGQTLYLYCDDFSSYKFVFSFQEGASVTGAISSIEPVPGTAYDFVNYQNAWNLVPNPSSDVAMESVTLTYEGLDGTPVTEKVNYTPMLEGGAFRIPTAELIAARDAGKIKEGTEVVFTLSGVKAGGVYVTEYKGEGADFVTIGENGLVEVSFLLETPIQLMTKEIPNPLYTVYAADSDVKAILTFSGDVESVSGVKILAGRVVPGDTGGEAIPAYVSVPNNNIRIAGNSITVNFAGLDLSSIPTGTVTFMLSYVVGKNGLTAAFDGYSDFVEYVTLKEAAPAPELPEPVVSANVTFWTGGGYFDAFDVIWWKEANVPYVLELGDTSGIKVTKDGEPVEILGVNLTEYQESVDPPTTNYEDSRLVVTLADFQFDIDATYVLNIPAGAVYVLADGQKVPCGAITYSVVPGQQGETPSVEIPAPTVNPSEGEVDALDTIQLSWEGFEVNRRGNGEGGFLKNITLSINGGAAQDLETYYIGKESDAWSDFYPALGIKVNAKESGKYVITIPAGALYLANDVAGSVENDEAITLTYTVNIPSGPEFIPVPAQANPAPGVVASIGNVQIFWPDVKLEGCSRQPVILTPDQANRMFTITLNGQPVTLGSTFSAGRVVLQTVVIVDEATQQEIGDWDALTINWPDMAYFWKGELAITLNEGTVMAADGKTNESAKFVYNIAEVMTNTWTPAQAADGSETFYAGEDNTISAVWNVEGNISLVASPEIPIYYQKYDETSDDGIGGQIPAAEFLSTDGNKLNFNISSFGTGRYVFVIPEATVNLGAGYVNGESQYNFVIENPAADALVFADWSMELEKGKTLSVNVPVSLATRNAFTYKGFQFDITLPEGLEVTEATLAESGDVEFDTQNYDGNANTTRFVATLDNATALTEDIITLTVSGAYGDINPGVYDVTIQNTVFFSTPTGSDITTVVGSTGTVTVTLAKVAAESIEFNNVELVAPSFTDQEGDVDTVTQGEMVSMDIVVMPEDSNEELEVSITEGANIEFDPESGKWIIDTTGVEVAPGEEVTINVTATAGDVTEEYTLTVKGVILGDSNANGLVTVADVVTTANYIAEKDIDNFCFPNANVILTPNEEGEQVINGQDLSATINIVLKNWNGERNPQNIRRHANRVVTNDRLVADSFHAGHSVIGISLENTMNYSVLQATVELPAGMKVENVTAGPRAAAHELVYNVKGSELNVVLFSYENASFRDGEGSLFNIAVAADENCGDLQMRNIMAADASANGYELSFEGGLNAGTTGIEGIGSDSEGVRYFTVDGIEVLNPEAGQLLIRVANGTAEKVLVK